jgi:hypothetical protein
MGGGVFAFPGSSYVRHARGRSLWGKGIRVAFLFDEPELFKDFPKQLHTQLNGGGGSIEFGYPLDGPFAVATYPVLHHCPPRMM